MGKSETELISIHHFWPLSHSSGPLIWRPGSPDLGTGSSSKDRGGVGTQPGKEQAANSPWSSISKSDPWASHTAPPGELVRNASSRISPRTYPVGSSGSGAQWSLGDSEAHWSLGTSVPGAAEPGQLESLSWCPTVRGFGCAVAARLGLSFMNQTSSLVKRFSLLENFADP